MYRADDRLAGLWKLQGPAPGLGVVLSVLHPGLNGTLFAMAVTDALEPNADPWPLIDGILSEQEDAPPGTPQITGMLRKRWARLKSQPAQMDFLRLLARIELTREQAQRAMAMRPDAVLANPYLLFEDDRSAFDPISFATVAAAPSPPPVLIDYDDAVATATFHYPESGETLLRNRRQVRKSERTYKSRLG